tara:strand:+ start:156 stop:599 length:444 start_codon:yes stop_codon:yes gene_type:complete
MSLPFPLRKNHRSDTKSEWKTRGGMNIDPDDFPYVYNEYIHATHCDLCNKQFTKSLDRQLDHCHKTGEVRNIVCLKCNHHKKDYPSNTNTGLKHISSCKKKIKNGYTIQYQFRIFRDGKHIMRKSSADLDKLIKIRDEFIKNNDIYR